MAAIAQRIEFDWQDVNLTAPLTQSVETAVARGRRKWASNAFFLVQIPSSNFINFTFSLSRDIATHPLRLEHVKSLSASMTRERDVFKVFDVSEDIWLYRTNHGHTTDYVSKYWINQNKCCYASINQNEKMHARMELLKQPKTLSTAYWRNTLCTIGILNVISSSSFNELVFTFAPIYNR